MKGERTGGGGGVKRTAEKEGKVYSCGVEREEERRRSCRKKRQARLAHISRCVTVVGGC